MMTFSLIPSYGFGANVEPLGREKKKKKGAVCWCSISDCIFAPTHSFPSVSRAGSCQSSSFGSLFKDNDTLMGCPARHEQEQDTCQRKTWGETVCVCVGVHVRVLVYVFVCNLYPFWNKFKKKQKTEYEKWLVSELSVFFQYYWTVTAWSQP